MKGYPLLKAISQSLDRLYLWWTLEKGRVDHRPSSSDFNSFATEKYLDSPQLFYSNPGKIPDIRFIGGNRLSGIEVSRLTFPSPVQTRYRENNVVYDKLFRCIGSPPLSSIIVLHGWSRPVLTLEERLCIALGQRGITSLLHLPFLLIGPTRGCIVSEVVKVLLEAKIGVPGSRVVTS